MRSSRAGHGRRDDEQVGRRVQQHGEEHASPGMEKYPGEDHRLRHHVQQEQPEGLLVERGPDRPDQGQVPGGPEHAEYHAGRQRVVPDQQPREGEPPPTELLAQPVGEDQYQKEGYQTQEPPASRPRQPGLPGATEQRVDSRHRKGEGGGPGENHDVPPPADPPPHQARPQVPQRRAATGECRRDQGCHCRHPAPKLAHGYRQVAGDQVLRRGRARHPHRPRQCESEQEEGRQGMACGLPDHSSTSWPREVGRKLTGASSGHADSRRSAWCGPRPWPSGPPPPPLLAPGVARTAF